MEKFGFLSKTLLLKETTNFNQNECRVIFYYALQHTKTAK